MNPTEPKGPHWASATPPLHARTENWYWPSGSVMRFDVDADPSTEPLYTTSEVGRFHSRRSYRSAAPTEVREKFTPETFATWPASGAVIVGVARAAAVFVKVRVRDEPS